jgi:hypothetical protein
MGEHLLSQNGMAAEHVLEGLVHFLAESAHDANAGEGFPHAPVNSFGVLT